MYCSPTRSHDDNARQPLFLLGFCYNVPVKRNLHPWRLCSMNTQRIFTKNAAYQKFEVIKSNRNKRYKYQEFFAEGVRNINEAVKYGWEINSFLYSFEKPLSSWASQLLMTTATKTNYELTTVLMQDISNKGDTSEVLAIVNMRDERACAVAYSASPVLALFDRPSNKGNLGTLLRSCDALGVEQLVITGHAVDVYEPDVITSSMGSFFKVPFLRLLDNAQIDEYIAGLREKYPGLLVAGTTAHKQKSIYEVDLQRPVLFLIGNETDGLNQHLCECSDLSVTIPMSEQSSASSFNVSCAATVMFYEAFRQRSK